MEDLCVILPKDFIEIFGNELIEKEIDCSYFPEIILENELIKVIEKDMILPFINRGDYLMNVTIPEDEELISTFETYGNGKVYLVSRIILKGLEEITEELVERLYQISNSPNGASPHILANVASKDFKKISYDILKNRVSDKNIKYFLSEFDESMRKLKPNDLTKSLREDLVEISDTRLITRFIDRDVYEKDLTQDAVINITGQSGAGKSYYASLYKNNKKYAVIDTDDVFGTIRFEMAKGINKEIGTYFREKYKENLPSLDKDFDLIYEEILNYMKKYPDVIIVIDSAMFHAIHDVKKLKGKVVVIRTCIDLCYKRCIERYKNKKPNYTTDELEVYKLKKKKIFKWYKFTNEFIVKIDNLNN